MQVAALEEQIGESETALGGRRGATTLAGDGADHEPDLEGSGIPADVHERFLPGDEANLPEFQVAGGFVYRALKRSFDVAFSAAVVAVLALPVAVACAAIRMESAGAPIYAQERVGMGGRAIRILKLRSMVADAGDVEKYLSADQLRQWQVERKVDDDPRVTRVGRFIRKTSLDELPQFLNVLKGDLSVIGPRPITEDELEQHFTQAEREELLSVRPGITGLWQATERNSATFESGRRQQIELRYVRERGFSMDVGCFFGTFGAMFGKKRTGR